MNYQNYLTLYSGGVDSTLLLQENPSAKNLIHYRGLNEFQTKVAWANALALDRTIDLVSAFPGMGNDGEVSRFHSLVDAQMILDACLRAVKYGKSGIVLGFNKSDLGTDFEAILSIVKRVEPNFDIALPLMHRTAEEIRSASKGIDLPTVSCMINEGCGRCPKCNRGY